MEERLKLAASGLQALALALLAAVVLPPPEINVGLVAPAWAKAAAGVVAGVAELSAFTLLGHIPAAQMSWTMVDLLGNLLIFFASAAAAAGVGYAALRVISRHH